MVRKLVATITITHEGDENNITADLHINGEHNDNMTNALLAQSIILQELIMDKITGRAKRIYNATDSFKPNKTDERSMNQR